MMLKYFFLLTIPFFLTLNAFAETTSIEYRLRSKVSGVDFKWSEQVGGKNPIIKIEKLESSVFLSNEDFAKATIHKLKSPPSDPNTYEIVLLHSDSGRKKLMTIANKDREREFCLVIDHEVFQCLAFPPQVKGLWDKSTSIYGPFSKTNADILAAKLNQAIKLKYVGTSASAGGK